jgi:hypothetical protein
MDFGDAQALGGDTGGEQQAGQKGKEGAHGVASFVS